MILEIRLSNFFSIKEEVIIDMRAAKIKSEKARQLSNNTFFYERTELLKTIAIYGANASGKSNIIKAIRFCVAMIHNSHNHNQDVQFNFKPFKFLSKNTPSKFFINFVSNGIEYEYAFELNQKQILAESLHYYPKGRIAEIFTRDERRGKRKKAKYTFQSVIKRPWDIAENTSEKTLYLSRASQMDRDIAKELFNYFHQQFVLAYVGFNTPATEILFTHYKSELLEALKVADSDICDIKIRRVKNKGKHFNANLTDLTLSVEDVIREELRITSYHKSAPNVAFDFFTEESAGTIKLFFIMLSILDSIKNNKILLIDEIGESLHTDIIEYIFNLFKASEKAQLICTTHNTNFLDLNKFRKDQIYFVNKKADASTDLYSLYDYNDFRDTMDLEKAYLQGRFDAVPYIDDSLVRLKSIIDG